MEQEKPNYYAIIPANVRYDNRLRQSEKLFYGEITALTFKTGECWASNTYFAKLYEVTPQAISKWILDLQKYGYIDVEYKYNGKEVEKRIIKVSTYVDRYQQKYDEGINKSLGGYQQKFKENNTSNNNTSINNNTYSVTEKQYEEFMEEYPKKTKTESVKRWFALNKPSETFFKILIDKVKEFKEYECKGKELRYIPDALTWLNEKRFKDEYKPKEIVQEVKTSKYSQTTPKNAKFENSREYTEDFYESLYD